MACSSLVGPCSGSQGGVTRETCNGIHWIQRKWANIMGVSTPKPSKTKDNQELMCFFAGCCAGFCRCVMQSLFKRATKPPGHARAPTNVTRRCLGTSCTWPSSSIASGTSHMLTGRSIGTWSEWVIGLAVLFSCFFWLIWGFQLSQEIL